MQFAQVGSKSIWNILQVCIPKRRTLIQVLAPLKFLCSCSCIYTFCLRIELGTQSIPSEVLTTRTRNIHEQVAQSLVSALVGGSTCMSVRLFGYVNLCFGQSLSRYKIQKCLLFNSNTWEYTFYISNVIIVLICRSADQSRRDLSNIMGKGIYQFLYRHVTIKDVLHRYPILSI